MNDGEGLLEATAAGLGKSLLPSRIADKDPRLRRLCLPSPPPKLPQRELWLLVHAELRPLARIAAVADWLASLLRPERLSPAPAPAPPAAPPRRPAPGPR